MYELFRVTDRLESPMMQNAIMGVIAASVVQANLPSVPLLITLPGTLPPLD
jgi:hypothetical protein